MDRPLAPSSYSVLAAVASLENAYANAVWRYLNVKGQVLELRAIHTRLVRLTKVGYLSASQQENLVAADGRRRSVVAYRLTAEGARALAANARFYDPQL